MPQRVADLSRNPVRLVAKVETAALCIHVLHDVVSTRLEQWPHLGKCGLLAGSRVITVIDDHIHRLISQALPLACAWHAGVELVEMQQFPN